MATKQKQSPPSSKAKGRYVVVPANGEGALLESQLTQYVAPAEPRKEQGTDNSNSLLPTSGGKCVSLTGMSRDKFSFAADETLKPRYVTPAASTSVGHKIAQSEIVLINREHATDKFRGKAFLRNGIEVICDSGGFQLARGIVDFVDLDELGAFYTEHATMGMGLDLPIHPEMQDAYLLRSAKLQRLANRHLLKVAPSVSLFTVSHGSTPAYRDKYMEEVYDPKIKRLALGGIGTMKTASKSHNIPLATHALMHMAHTYGSKYEHLHVLGTTSSYWMLVYQFIALLGNTALVTSDSVTHLKAAVSGGFIMPTGYGLPQRIHINRNMPKYGPSAALCGCPVCTVMGQDYQNFSVTPRALALHNLHALHAQARTMRNFAEAFIAGDPFNRLFEFMGTKAKVKEWRKQYAPAIRYVLDTYEKGFNKARFSNAEAVASLNNTSLISGLTQSKPVMNPKRVERYNLVLKNYSKFLGVKL